MIVIEKYEVTVLQKIVNEQCPLYPIAIHLLFKWTSMYSSLAPDGEITNLLPNNTNHSSVHIYVNNCILDKIKQLIRIEERVESKLTRLGWGELVSIAS